MQVVPLRDAADVGRYGGKAAALAVALRGGLPVPDGVALDAELVVALLDGRTEARSAVAAAVAGCPGRSPSARPPARRTAHRRASRASTGRN